MYRAFLTLAAAGCLALGLRAAVPEASPEKLRREATHIVVGRVVRVYSAPERAVGKQRMVRLVAEVTVQEVEKGESVRPGDTIFARYWRAEWLGTPEEAPPDATTSIAPAPRAGDRVRAYLGLDRENGLGKDSGRGLNVLFPNGFQILPRPGPPARKQPSP
jgi:hypothetical protein